jgi:hypothetical protein
VAATAAGRPVTHHPRPTWPSPTSCPEWLADPGWAGGLGVREVRRAAYCGMTVSDVVAVDLRKRRVRPVPRRPSRRCRAAGPALRV